MRQRLFSGLIFKVGLVIIVIEIVVLTSTGIYYTRQFNEQVDARVYSRVAIPGQLMAKGMLEYEVVRDRAEMTDLAGDDLVEAIVIAVTGKVFYSFHTEYEGRDTSQVPGLSSEWFSPSVTESFIREETEAGNRYVVSVTPIFASGTRKPYYFFYLKMSTNQAAQEKQDIAGLFLIGAIVCVFLTSLTILFIFRIMVSKRLYMALDGIKRFEFGDLDARIEPVESNDEIATLQHGINSMTSKLQEIIGNLRAEVTERKRAEEEKATAEAHLQQSQKLESIGTFASGVAHEINNPLMGMIGYAELISDAVDDPKTQGYSAGIIKEGNRIATIVHNLLTFSRQDKETHSPAEIKDIVDASLSLFSAVLRKDQITLDLDIPKDLPRVKCRSQQIQQVVINLLTNARDALNERYPEYDENKLIRIAARPLEKEGAAWVRIMVEDHGSGIPEKVAKRIFDPFFTTKPREKGTGLGLSVSYGIVREHNGELGVESMPGEYTRFLMDLRVNNGWTLKDQEAES